MSDEVRHDTLTEDEAAEDGPAGTWAYAQCWNEGTPFLDPADGVRITEDGFTVCSDRDGETSVEYDRRKYRIERDPKSDEQVEKFKLVRK
jgi:hypothetical protein